MLVVHERCCGLDVHKKTVSACLATPGSDKKPHKEVRSFRTTTQELLSLRDWLVAAGCTHVAMESTGVYWKPVYNLLEGSMAVMVVNAQHMKAVPGRKTDVADAEWIADLLRHGLLSASFIPSKPLRELRELVRYRTALIQERSAEVNRLQKVLEGANIKLSSVVSDVMGVSGRLMLEALVEGTATPEQMANLAKRRLRKKIPELQQALSGRVEPHHQFILAQQLAHVDALDELIESSNKEIEVRMQPNDGAIARLCTIPGVDRRAAELILAEIGPDMSRFPTHKHLASWAGICPGNHESAGKRRSGKTRKGSRWLRSILVQAAHGAAHSQKTYLSALYHRLASRRGAKKAIVAVAHAILVIAYHLLLRETSYQELGPNYFDQMDREKVQNRLIKRLEALGCRVVVDPAQPMPPAV